MNEFNFEFFNHNIYFNCCNIICTGWTLRLTECGTDITKENADSPFLCRSIKKCFQKSVLSRLKAFGFPKLLEAWYWMEEIANQNCK